MIVDQSRFVLVSVLLLSTWGTQVAAQPVQFDRQAFDETLETARSTFGGDLLLYYHRPGSPLSDAIETTLLTDAAVSALRHE